MTAYAKPPVKPAWAESASNPADIVTMTDADVQSGWPLSPTPPSRQRFNYILNFCANAIRYFCQRGLPDWDAAESYTTGAIVRDTANGLTYQALVNTINQRPSTNPAVWTGWGHTDAKVTSLALTFLKNIFNTVPAGAPTLDLNVAWKFDITMNVNNTPNFLNIAANIGAELVFIIHQDAVGGRVWTWPASVRGGGAIDPTPNSTSIQKFVVIGDQTLRAITPMTVT
jgi:hypothetical protein